MQLDEALNPEQKKINGEQFSAIKVVENEHTKYGKEVHKVFNGDEYKALQIFIQLMKPKIANRYQTNVFSVLMSMKYASSKNARISSAWRILQSFQIKSGKKLSSNKRITRY